jgi:CPA2 family monovalent cation:H+ antiporter-2
VHAHEFLKALASVLCVAAVTTVLFQRLRQPVVLGYIIAGIIVGPHVPIPLVADPEIIRTLSEVGVILLIFSLGLEFSLRKLLQMGPMAGLTAVFQCSVMIWLGFVVGRLFGWTTRECIFAGSIIAISSTTIIAKVFDDQGIKGKLRDLVVGVLIVEDLIAILLMAMLTAISAGGDLSAATVARSTGRLTAFLLGLVVVGLLLVPRFIRMVSRLRRAETTLVASVGICFASALLALELGYSVALGAFIAGSLVAESGAEKHVERLIQPVRDMFAAIFFVSVGMLIEPGHIARHWPAVAVLTAAVIVGKVLSVAVGAFLAGTGIRTAVQAGMSLAQIGEFSFIIAGLGVSLAAIGDFLYPVAVAVSALTTLTTPWLIRASEPVAILVDRKLPRPIQTFASLYGTWVERLRAAKLPPEAKMRRLATQLLLDFVLLGAIVVGAAVSLPPVTGFLAERLGIAVRVARVLVGVAAIGLATPFCIGIFRTVRRIGLTLAEAALPPTQDGKVDLADAPRRALVVTLQVAAVLLVGLPLLALTQPFLARFEGVIVLVVLLLALGVAFWRSATNLQGHVRAGAQMIVEVLSTQAKGPAGSNVEAVALMHQLLPGLGDPMPFRLHAASAAVGKTLAQLNLRGSTGATVLAIIRGEQGVIVPSAKEVLRNGDILALAGTHDAVDAARAVLESTES